MTFDNYLSFSDEESVPYKESLYCSLPDNYECSFNDYFGIFDLIVPPEISATNIEMFYNNNNIIVLIIEPMCIGILMSYQIASKFKYINNCIQYGDYSYIYENGMKIVKITKDWDTRKWSYLKIKKFYYNLEYFEKSSISHIEIDILNKNSTRRTYQYCDIEFLDSLCWDGDEF